MPNNPSVLVCVTGQKTCDRLIQCGLLIAKEKNAPLFVLHVAKKDAPLMGAQSDGEALNYLYLKAAKAGAEMTVQRAEDARAAIAAYAKKIGATDVVLGMNPSDPQEHGFKRHLEALLKGAVLHVV